MRMILAAFAALLVFDSLPASAYPNTDDRYFDSRAIIHKSAVHKVAHRKVRYVRHQRVRIATPRNLVRGFIDEIGKATSDKMAGVVEPLRAKAREIVGACGSTVISAIRYTRVAGTGGRLSLHASGRAVDIKGNPSCIYSHLRGWPGGYSVDYGRVQHVHISYAPHGPEWGARFHHYGGGRHKHRKRYSEAGITIVDPRAGSS